MISKPGVLLQFKAHTRLSFLAPTSEILKNIQCFYAIPPIAWCNIKSPNQTDNNSKNFVYSNTNWYHKLLWAGQSGVQILVQATFSIPA